MWGWHKKDRNKRECRGEVHAVCVFHTQGSIAPLQACALNLSLCPHQTGVTAAITC